MKTLLLDTNMIMLPFQKQFDLFGELERVCDFDYELKIIPQVTEELTKLSEGNSNQAREAKMGLQLISQKNIPTEDLGNGYADDVLQKSNYIVVSRDLGLIKRIEAEKRPYITVRQGSHLMLMNADHL